MAVADATPIPVEVVEGFFVWGHEVRSFRPCGSEEELWAVGDPEVMEPLIAAHQQLTDKPYQGVYVRFRGRMSDAERPGFAADFAGMFRVVKVLEIRPATDTDCPPDE